MLDLGWSKLVVIGIVQLIAIAPRMIAPKLAPWS